MLHIQKRTAPSDDWWRKLRAESHYLTRVAAIQELGGMDVPVAVSYLSSLLRDECLSVRIAAVSALRARKEPEAHKALQDSLIDPAQDPWVVQKVVTLLGKTIEPAYLDKMLERMKDTTSDPLVRIAAADAALRSNRPELQKEVLKALTQDPSPSVREEIATFLATRRSALIQTQQNADALCSVLAEDPEPSVRTKVAILLRKKTGEPWGAALRRAVSTDVSPKVRRAAAKSLGSQP